MLEYASPEDQRAQRWDRLRFGGHRVCLVRTRLVWEAPWDDGHAACTGVQIEGWLIRLPNAQATRIAFVSRAGIVRFSAEHRRLVREVVDLVRGET